MRLAIALILSTLLAVPPAFAREIKLALLGDSITAGYGLQAADALPHQLETWLKAQGFEVAITAKGISGDTTYGGRVRAYFLPTEADAVIIELGANDMLMGLSPTQAARNLSAIVDHASRRERPVMVLGIDPAWASTAVRRSWRNVWAPLATGPTADYVADMLAPITARPAGLRGDWLQSDGLHPNRDGVAAIVAHIGPPIAAWLQRNGLQ